MTDKIGASAREVAGPGVEIVALANEGGPAAIESHTDEVAAAAGVVREAARAEAEGSAGFVIACFGDPGLDAARELTSGPVVGIAEAAMHAATLVGRHFGVVTTLSRTLGQAEHLVHRYGFERHCVANFASDIPVLELEDTASDAYETIASLAERAVRENGADSIVLGCAGMTDLCHSLQQRLGVPVIDGVQASVGLVASLVRMGVGTSKRDEYALPPRR